jgi:hypothetical protein
MSIWRKKFKVHPGADVFPMMDDDELAKLGEDIKANGLKEPISVYYPNGLRGEAVLLDGRNRLEAVERAGLSTDISKRPVHTGDPVAYIISANIHRRHLTKAEKADLIVAAHKAAEKAADKPVQVEPVFTKGGRGKVNKLKAAVVADAAKAHISESEAKRALARAEGKTPAPKKRRSKAEIAEAQNQGVDAVLDLAAKSLEAKPKHYTARPMPKPKSGKPVVGIDAVRQCYLDRCSEPDVDLDAEQEIIIDALREIAGKRAMRGHL